MKVAVEVTESFEGGNVKQEFEGDFFQVTSLKRTCDSENGYGFHIRSMSLGERFKPDEVVEALADNMLNAEQQGTSDQHGRKPEGDALAKERDPVVRVRREA